MRSISSLALAASDIDYALHMRRALYLARSCLTTTPNPRVGCVLVAADNEVVGEGWHQAPGQAHAEPNALQQAEKKSPAKYAFVSLEPCSHFDKTPPCTDALIKAGIQQVIIATVDPYPAVDGKGIAQLEAAGIDVLLLEDFREEAKRINAGYFKRLTRGRPYVRCKLAMSLDGRTAAADRTSQWITTAAARADVQRLRAASCAILTGINTVLDDDPALTVRPEQLDVSNEFRALNRYALERQPLRIVLDSKLRTPATAKILQSAGEVVLYSCVTESDQNRYPDNVQIISGAADSTLAEAEQKLELKSVLESLAASFSINELLVEAGPTLSGALVKAGLVDELVVYVGAKLLGSRGLPLLDLPGMEGMTDQIELTITDVTRLGQDCRITACFASEETTTA